jgi:hypothetical protein
MDFWKMSCFDHACLLSLLGNCNIDFLVFHHHLWMMSPKFLKFKRGLNSGVKF